MHAPSAELARTITRNSSKQSYYTARLLVDKELEADCYRAYAYFRWADDVVDEHCRTRPERLAFMARQRELLQRCYLGVTLADKASPDKASPALCPEEQILIDLIRNARGNPELLRSYIENFLAIIAYDAERKGELVNQRELDWYAATLGKAVTDGIQYFICNGYPYPEGEARYLAATAAHITHMLRDLAADLPDGYVNLPREYLELHRFDPADFSHPAMRAWVMKRVALAREYFRLGKQYLDTLPVLRCKIVGYWYCARFEHLLEQIEADNYVLRASYAKPPRLLAWLKFAGLAVWISLCHWGNYLLRNGCWVPRAEREKTRWQPLQVKDLL